jgi:CRP-like cAMP-binding protein
MNKKHWMKIISLCLCVVFTATQIVLSAPPVYSIKVDEGKGSVQQRFKGSEKKTIIHIQDAHTSFEAQQNLARIICDLIPTLRSSSQTAPASAREDRTPFVGIEGALGEYDLKELRDFPLKKQKEIVSAQYVKEGKFIGAEYASVISGDDFTLVGLEDKGLLQKDFQSFYDVSKKMPELEAAIEELEEQLALLKDAYFSDELKEFDRHVSSFENDASSSIHFFSTLYQAIEENGIDVSEYVNLLRFKEVFLIDSRIDRPHLNREISRLAEELNHVDEIKDTVVALYARYTSRAIHQKEVLDYLLGTAEKYSVPIKAYTNAKYAKHYWSAFSSLDMNQVLYEAMRASYAIKYAMATTADSVTIISIGKRLNILKRVLALKAVREDIDEFRRDRRRYSFSAVASDLARFGLERAHAMSALDSVLEQAADFYTYAEARDQVMVENVITAMDHKNQDVGIVVAGGYHSEGITEILKNKNISFVTIRPHITKVTEDVAYMDRMLGNIFSVDAFLTSMLHVSRINMAARTLNPQGYDRFLQDAEYEMHGNMLIDPQTQKPLSLDDLRSLSAVLHNSGDSKLIELAKSLERIIADQKLPSTLATTQADTAALRSILRDVGIALKGNILLEQYVTDLQKAFAEPGDRHIDQLNEHTPLAVFIDLIEQTSISDDEWAQISGIVVKKGPRAVDSLLRVFLSTKSSTVEKRTSSLLKKLGPVLPDDINTIVGILSDSTVDIGKRIAVAQIFESLLAQASIDSMQKINRELRQLLADENGEASIKYYLEEIITAMNKRTAVFYEKVFRIENAEKTIQKHNVGFFSTISDREIENLKADQPFFVYADETTGLLEGYPSAPKEQGWNVTKTPMQVLVEDFKYDPLQDIIGRARRDPARTITIVDWGVGDGTGWLNEVAYGLEKNGVTNVRLIGFGNMYFPEWQKAHPRVEFILDTAENFHEYFEPGQIDLIVSHIGLFHLESVAYNAFFKRVHPLLNDDALVIHDYPLFRQSHIMPELEGLGYAIEKDVPLNWQTGCAIIRKQATEARKRHDIIEGKESIQPTVSFGDDSIQERVLHSKDEVLNELPGQIIVRLGRLGLSDEDLMYAKDVMEAVRAIYASMDEEATLIQNNYHNFMHNLIVTNAMLVMMEKLAEDGALSDARRDAKLAFLGAFFHDFHVRTVQTDTGVGTPANVSETLNQLKDIFGLEAYTSPVARVAATARYAALDDTFKQDLQAAINGFLSLHTDADPTRRQQTKQLFYDEMSVLILRTDFASDIPVAPKYKPATIKIREELNETIQSQITDGGMIGVDFVRLGIAAYYDELAERAQTNGDTDALAGINRQGGIEAAYLKGLEAVPLSRRAVLHTMALRLEKGGDQSGSTWMTAPELFDEIIVGLGKEIPGISPQGNFLFFESELLRTDVLEILRFLPEEYKNNFLKNVELSVENGRKLAEVLPDDVPIKGILAGAPERWNDSKQNILYVLGMSKNVLHGSRLHAMLTPHEFEMLINAVEVERFDADETIIVEGQSVADDGRFYEVISGQAQVFQNGTQIATVGPGEVLGEIGLVSQESRRTATVVMPSGSIVASIPHTVFNQIYAHNEMFRQYIDSIVQTRITPDEHDRSVTKEPRSFTKGWWTTLTMVGIFALASMVFSGADTSRASTGAEVFGTDRPERIAQASLDFSQQDYFGITVDAPRDSNRDGNAMQITVPIETDKSMDDVIDPVGVNRRPFAPSIRDIDPVPIDTNDIDPVSIELSHWITQSLDRTSIMAEHYGVLQSADLVSEETFGDVSYASFASQTYDGSLVRFMNDVFDSIRDLDGGDEKVRAIMRSIDHMVLSNSGWYNALGSGHGYYDDTIGDAPFRAVVLGVGSQAFTDSDWTFTELDTVLMAALLIHEVKHVENSLQGITDSRVGEELALFEGNKWLEQLCDEYDMAYSSYLASVLETEHFADNNYDNQFVKAHMYFADYPDAQSYVNNVYRAQSFAQSAAAMSVYGYVDRDTIENIAYQLEGTPETGIRQHSRIGNIAGYGISNIPEIARTGEVWEFDFTVYDDEAQIKNITAFATLRSEVVELKNSDTGELMMGNRYFGGTIMPDGSVRTFWINALPNNRFSIDEIKNDSIDMSSLGMLGMLSGLFRLLPGESVSARRREETGEAFPRKLFEELSNGMAETVEKSENILKDYTDIRLVFDAARLDNVERHEIETYARRHDNIQIIDVHDFPNAQKTFTQKTIVLMIGVKENEIPQVEQAAHARIFVGENIDVRTVLFASFALIFAALLVEAKERKMDGLVPIDGTSGIFKNMAMFVAHNETLIKAIRAEMTTRIIRTAA